MSLKVDKGIQHCLSSVGEKPTRIIVDDTVSNNALGTSAGVRGHGAAGRAGGAAPAARSQTPSFHTGMGKTAKIASHGGAVTRDGGARDAREIRSRCREARSTA